METFFTLEGETWGNLKDILLSLCQSHLMTANKYSVISTPQFAEDFSKLLAGTLFGTWIRAQDPKMETWRRLTEQLSQCTRWLAVVQEWTVAVTVLTDVLVANLLPKKHALASEVSPSHPLVASSKADNFASWIEKDWVHENSVFLWKLFLRILGDINMIERPDIHLEAISCYVWVQERLFNVVRLIGLLEACLGERTAALLCQRSPSTLRACRVFL